MIHLSVIIPTYKESSIINKQIEALFDRAFDINNIEIIICDTDNSTEVYDSRVKYFNCVGKGRSIQMNCGGMKALGGVLYFLHADSLPPLHFDEHILNEIKKGNEAGCFRLSFDTEHTLLKFSAWFTRFQGIWFRGGDQSLFITKRLFDELNGFNESFQIMEDLDMVKRIKTKTNFVIINKNIITSARKYLANGVYKLQFLFTILHIKYRLGFSQRNMVRFYKRHIFTP